MTPSQAQEITINGQPNFVYQAPLSIADVSWRVVMVVPVAKFAEGVDFAPDRWLPLAAGILTVGLVVSVGSGRLIIRSIQQLQELAQRLRKGELHQPVTLPVKEFQSLAEDWQMFSFPAQASMAVLPAEPIVFFQQEAVLNGIFGDDGTILKVNGAWKRLLGYSEESLIGRNLEELCHPEDRERILGAHGQLQSPPHCPEKLGLEKLMTRCLDIQGSYHYLEWWATRIDAKIYASLRDVTPQILAEQNLRQREERLRMFSALSPAQIYILVVHPDGSLSSEFISDAVESIYEYPVAEMLGNANLMGDCIHPEDRQDYESYFKACQRTQSRCDHEWRIVTASGQIKWIRGRSHPVLRENGDVAWYGVIEDITHQKQRTAALKEREQRLQTTLDLNFLGSWDWHPVTNEIHWSSHKYLLLGISPTELASYESFMAAVHPDDRDRVQGAITHAVATGLTYDCEFRVVHPDGQIHWLRERGECCYEDGRVIRMVGVVYGIDNNKVAELELARQSELLGSIFDTSDDLLCFCDSQGILLRLNAAWEKILGYASDSLLGRSFMGLVHPDDHDATLAALEHLSQGHPLPLFTNRYVASDGSLRWIEWRAAQLRDGSVYEAGRDITERKQLELALSDAEARLRFFLNHSSAVIFIKDLAGRYQWVNLELLRVLGVNPEDILGRTDEDFFPPENAQEIRSLDVAVCTEQITVRAEEVVPLADGDHTFFVTKFPLLRGGEPYAIGGICVDISDRVRAEATLREREEQLESFFSLSTDGFFFMMLDRPIAWNEATDKDQALDYAMEHLRITKANQSFAAQYGCSVAQVLGRAYCEFFAGNLAGGRAALRELFDDGLLRCETQERTFDGRDVWIEGDYICLYDSLGWIRGHFGIQRDITQRQEAQRELLRAKELAEQVPGLRVSFYPT
ncbi:MAG: PAS domain S-box protein [Oscillatoriales cyanobacterium SM2_2_1]|nr:PAS domain S-box protein [Oscillatoriales cyanobacterium SM2_2_1]